MNRMIILKSITTNKERRTTNARRRCAAASGVTLIELLMVMVIMAIVMAVSVPAFNSMGKGSDLRGAVTAVRNTISQSRQWAITHREQITFCYNASNYYVTNTAGVLIQDTNTLPRAVRFAHNGGAVSTLTFKTDGALSVGAVTVHVTLLSSNDAIRTIAVNGLTGGIRVQ